MSIAPYRDILRLPGVARLLGFAVLARIPQTASSVVLTLYVVGGLHLGYVAAGAVATATTAGMALGSPWRGRVIDRRGLRRALLPSVIVSALACGVAPFVGFWPLVAVGFLAGLLGVPVYGVVRQSLAVLVPPVQRRTGFALDSIGTEISYMVGPAAGVLLATRFSPAAALVTVGAGSALSGLGLILLNPPTRSAGADPDPGDPQDADGHAPVVRPAGPEPGKGVHWYSPALLGVLAAALAAGLVLAGTDVGLVAQLRAAGALSLTGLVFLAWSSGSVIGGAVYGGMRRPVPPQVLLLAMAVLTVPVGLAPTPILLVATILPAAALCAPLISATAEAVSRLVPERSRGEAMGWHGSALTVGSALGAPLSGAAIDAVAPWAGFAAVGAVGGVLGLAALLLQRKGRSGAVQEVPAGSGTQASGAPGGPGAGDGPGAPDRGADGRVTTW